MMTGFQGQMGLQRPYLVSDLMPLISAQKPIWHIPFKEREILFVFLYPCSPGPQQYLSNVGMQLVLLGSGISPLIASGSWGGGSASTLGLHYLVVSKDRGIRPPKLELQVVYPAVWVLRNEASESNKC